MKTVMLSILILAFFGSLTAEYATLTIEGRAIAFFPLSDRFTKIYGNTIGCYEVEATTDFFDCFDLWANFDWISKKGRSSQLHNFTRISIANYSLGIKFRYPISDNFTAYLGLGPTFGRVHLVNRAPAFHKKSTTFAWGGVVKTGLYYCISRRWFLDLFFDYLYQPSVFKTHVDIGGGKLGVGVGCKF